MGMLGASRMSSVSGLKVRPKMATVRPRTDPPAAAMMRAAMLALRASLTATTASISRDGVPWSWAMRTIASVSLGKQDPPKPGPGWRNLRPMRPSRPMPRATSCTSAPARSQMSAISLMKVTFIARKEFAAYFTSSAVSRLVNRIGASIR